MVTVAPTIEAKLIKEFQYAYYVQDGETALMGAAMGGSVEVVKYLAGKGADLNVQRAKVGSAVSSEGGREGGREGESQRPERSCT